jgi:hypothetical protein
LNIVLNKLIILLLLRESTFEQCRRNRGGARGGQAPPSFGKCPFFGCKVPIFSVKKIIKIAFFSLSALLKTSIYVIFGKILKFGGKIPYTRKIFMYFRKFFFVFRKNYGMSGKFFWPPKWYTDRNIFGWGGGSPTKKCLSALFFRKVPLRAWPPQLFEASYDPAFEHCTY